LITKFIRNKKGTAEIIGSVLFIVILLFFFTNVYLWHDAATKEMNSLQLQKMNSGISMIYYNDVSTGHLGTIILTDNGGLDVVLSRLWINEEIEGGNHLFANLEPLNVRVAASTHIEIRFATPISSPPNPNDPVQVEWDAANARLTVYYEIPAGIVQGQSIRFVILNTLGLTAACEYIYF
jgi:hypothetical protein